jgi:WD40 repeat protein
MRNWKTILALIFLCVGCARHTSSPDERRFPKGGVDAGDAIKANGGKLGGKGVAGRGEKSGPAVRGPTCAAFSPDGRHIAVGFSGRGLEAGPLFHIWDVKTRKPVSYWHLPPPARGKNVPPIRLDREYHSVIYIAYILGGKFILTVEQDNMCRLWKASEGKLVREFSVDEEGARGASLSANGKLLMRSIRGGFAVWEVATGRIAMRQQKPRTSVNQFALAPDGRRAILRFSAGAEDRTDLVYWDFQNEKAVLRLDTASVNGVDPDELVTIPMLFSPDGRTVLATKRKGDLLGQVLCDATDLKERKAVSPMRPWRKVMQAYTFGLPMDSYRAIFSPDGKKLVTREDYPNTVFRRFCCLDLNKNRELWNMERRRHWTYVDRMLAYSPTEDVLFAVKDRKGLPSHRLHETLIIINAQDGSIVGTLDTNGVFRSQ